MGDRCTGHCCKKFNLPYGPEVLWDMYDRWVKSGDPAPKNDIHIIAPMVKYLGFVDGSDVSAAEGMGHYYTCKHHDEATGNCGIYEHRPLMCRDYPYGRSCRYTACEWEDGKQGLYPEHSSVDNTLKVLAEDDPRAKLFRNYGRVKTETEIKRLVDDLQTRYIPDHELLEAYNRDGGEEKASC